MQYFGGFRCQANALSASSQVVKRPWESLLRSYRISAQDVSARLNLNYAVFRAGINQHHTKSIVFNRLRGVVTMGQTRGRIPSYPHKCACASARKRAARPANLWSWMTSRDHQVSLDSCIAVHYCHRSLIASWGIWGEGICRLAFCI